jgi:hypothetical protein
MKPLTHVFTCSAMLGASLILFSCKKQFVAKTELQATASIQAESECRLAVFGGYYYNQWTTLAQKWYSNGKVKYLKAKSTRYTPTYTDLFLELMYDLEWGEVLYQGNQVYLKDVLNNRTLIRVTLDDNGRPEASYYYNQRGTNVYWYDTTYYYYNGDRLDDMISFFETNEYGTASPVHSWRRYKFTYDSWGNVIKAGTPERPDLTFNIEYDYTKPVRGIILNYQLTSSLSLLENLELIKLPMHHVVTRIAYGDPSNSTQYKDYQITDGFVRSYVCIAPPFSTESIFYNGWDCGTNISNGPANAIANLQQFQKLYPTDKAK